MAIDPSIYFAEHLAPDQLLYNAMRQSGMGFDLTNPRVAALARMAPALMRAYELQQAAKPELSAEELLGPGSAVQDFFMRAVAGGGRDQIRTALAGLPDLIQNARTQAKLGMERPPSTNEYFEDLIRLAGTSVGDTLGIFSTLRNPFLPQRIAEGAQSGRRIGMLGQYEQGLAEGESMLDRIFGAVPNPTPRDLASPAPPGAPAALPGPAPVPQGLEINPVVPSPTGLPPGVEPIPLAPLPSGPALGPADPTKWTDEERRMVEEAFGQRQQAKRGLSKIGG